jgi:hypothetical protein
VTKQGAGGAQHQTPLAAPPRSVPSAAERAGTASPEEAGAAICRPADVTVSVQPTALRITSRGVSCRLARVPSVQSGATVPAPARSFGTLPPGGTATAPLSWTTSCRASAGEVIRIDWGAGPVEVHPAGLPEAFCAPPSVGPFAGLR